MNTSQHLKIAATIVAAIPIIFFLIFAVGEGGGGWPHYVQAAIPTMILLTAWWEPKHSGYLLLTLGILFGVVYIFGAAGQKLITTILVEMTVAAPTAIAGYLFIRSAR